MQSGFGCKTMDIELLFPCLNCTFCEFHTALFSYLFLKTEEAFFNKTTENVTFVSAFQSFFSFAVLLLTVSDWLPNMLPSPLLRHTPPDQTQFIWSWATKTFSFQHKASRNMLWSLNLYLFWQLTILAAECQVMSEQQNQKAGSMQVGFRQVATIKHGLPRGSNANKTGRITAGKIHNPPH